MASFLDHYEGTTTVDLGNGYHVELWDHASEEALEEADRAMSKMQIVDGKTDLQADLVRYRQLVILAHLKEWNLDDEGITWPYTIESVKRLPKRVFNQVWAIVDKLDAPETTEDRKRFPDASGGVDPVGKPGAANAGEVPARATAQRKTRN